MSIFLPSSAVVSLDQILLFKGNNYLEKGPEIFLNNLMELGAR